MKQRVETSTVAALVAVQIFFASHGVAAKIALRQLPPLALSSLRMLLATVAFGALWLAAGRERIARRDLGRLVLCALFGIFLNQLLFFEGVARSTATNAMVLGGAIPPLTVGIAVLMRRETATLPKLAGLAVAFAGALVVTGLDGFRAGGTAFAGNLLLVGNCLSYSIFLVLARDLLARYRPLTVMTVVFAFGALAMLPVGGPPLVAALPHLSARTWGVVAYIVAAPSLGAYLLNAWALARAEASLVAAYVFLQPLFGAALAAAILGERPGQGTVVGGALILGGLWLTWLDARRRAVRSAAAEA